MTFAFPVCLVIEFSNLPGKSLASRNQIERNKEQKCQPGGLTKFVAGAGFQGRVMPTSGNPSRGRAGLKPRRQSSRNLRPNPEDEASRYNANMVESHRFAIKLVNVCSTALTEVGLRNLCKNSF